MKTMTRRCSVGIYENCRYVARVYADKIIVTIPYVRWTGNTGGYDERKVAIRESATVVQVAQDLADDAIDSAWAKIGRAIDDPYLANADF